MSNENRRLLSNVVCPHCWTSFAPEQALCISEAPELVGDPKVGSNEQLRFLPTEFDENGAAIDQSGYPCKDYACPHCHLRLPQGALEAPALFMSIVGGPTTGKSYYLSSSTFTLRQIFPRLFNINFTDADMEMNAILRGYEDKQFFSGNKLVKLEKTDTAGDGYDTIEYNGQTLIYPKPFVFSATPANEHPNAKKAETVARTLCLYDNSGESYLPKKDADTASSPVTRHLAKSKCVFYLFDPTQDPRFRDECLKFSQDPALSDPDMQRRQEAVLSEMSRRVRTYLRMKNTERYSNTFIVIVGKYDVWKPMAPDLDKKFVFSRKFGEKSYNILNETRIKKVSEIVRNLLLAKTPEFVAAAESFAQEVVYIPVSATGRSPIKDRDFDNQLKFRSTDIKPILCEIPMLYAIAKTAPGLVPIGAKQHGDVYLDAPNPVGDKSVSTANSVSVERVPEKPAQPPVPPKKKIDLTKRNRP